MDKKEDENNLLNDSNFQDEGEYIINQKPKYKYEIKIIHDTKKEKSKKKSKTPEKIFASSKFSIIDKPQKDSIKQNANNIYNKNDNYNNYNNNTYDNNYNNTYDNYNNTYDNYNNTYDNYNHYDNFNNFNNYNFYDSKSSKNKKDIKHYSKEPIPQTASQINIFSKTSDNFYNRGNYYKKYKYEFIDDEDIDKNKQCICQKEFNKIIQKYFAQGKIIKNNNYNKNYNNYNNYSINTNKNRREQNYISRNYIKGNSNHNSNRKRYFKTPLKIQKSIEKSFQPYKEEKDPYNIKKTNINIKNDANNIYIKNSNSKRNINNSGINLYNKNIYTKYISKNLNTNNYLYIKNKNKKSPEKKIQKQINYSFISIDDSKNKSLNSYDTNNITNKDINNIKPKNINENNKNNNSSISKDNKNNQLMIYKSSERRENIKSIPKGQKFEPLVIKKSVQKPIIEKIKKEDGSIINVMKQLIVVTSIETKPINNKSKNQDENLVKECITNIYTTLTKNIDEDDNKNLIKNKSLDDINKNINKKKDIFIKRKIMDKNNLQQNENLDINQNEINFNNNINNNQNKQFNIDISEISNDLLKNKTNNSSINYSSLISYEQIEPNNNVIRINEEIKFIKYLYYRCTNLNSINKAKLQSLSNYFLKLSDEEKIAILTNLNDGEQENKKIYNKLINILKEKRLNDENSINNKSGNNIGDNFISDYDEEDKKKKNVQTNILFKKKKIVK